MFCRFIASGHELKLVPDVSDVDPNGLKLRYVEQVDGVDLGAEMIEQGVAVIETTEPMLPVRPVRTGAGSRGSSKGRFLGPRYMPDRDDRPQRQLRQLR